MRGVITKQLNRRNMSSTFTLLSGLLLNLFYGVHNTICCGHSAKFVLDSLRMQYWGGLRLNSWRSVLNNIIFTYDLDINGVSKYWIAGWPHETYGECKSLRANPILSWAESATFLSQCSTLNPKTLNPWCVCLPGAEAFQEEETHQLG